MRFGQNVLRMTWNEPFVQFSWKAHCFPVLKSIPGDAQHVLAKWHFWASKLSKSSHSPGMLFKTGKQCAFHENCTKGSFQVMRSTFWPNRIFESQSCQNRHTGLKISPKRGKSELFMNIVQNARFRSYAARFGQIAFLRVKVVKIVTLAWNSFQNGKTVRFSLKFYKTLFSGHAQHVLAKLHFWASKLSKSSHWPEKLVKTRKQCAFHENCTKRAFQVMRSTFWPNRILERQSCQNRHTGLEFSSKRGKQCAFHKNCTKRAFQVMRSTFWPKRIFKRQSCQSRHTRLKFSSKRENSALFMKIVQNARFRSYAARFGQMAFLSVKVVKIVTLAWNALQNGKTVRFSWKLYKTLVSGHAQHVLAKSHF